MTELLSTLRRLKIVPVIVIDDATNAVPLANALIAGGLPCAEVTLRTAGAADALRRITAECPDMLVGAGTVLTSEQAATAKKAGARFIVSPGFHPRVVDYCRDNGLPVFPGICTPTEIGAALERGITVVKFFPAEPMGGLGVLKAVSAPYGDTEFIPTGGITAELLGAYLGFGRVVACGGSWMAPADWIAGKQFDRIRDETSRAMMAARTATGGAS